MTDQFNGWYWIDTKWGCGGILVMGSMVVRSAPIFKKLHGESIHELSRIYQVRKLS